MRGFLTPDFSVLSNPQDCRTISVPGDLWYLVSGALDELAEEHNWEEHGTATPVETAEFFQQVINEYLISMCNYIGEIRPFIISTLPDKWLPFDNTTYDEDDYPELFAVIPSAWILPPNYDTFRLPDLTSYGLAGQGSYNGFSAALGVRVGSSLVTLNTSQMPQHNHTYTPPVFNVDLEAPGVPDILAAGVGTPTTTSNAGSGQAHSNVPPLMGVNWGIYAGR